MGYVRMEVTIGEEVSQHVGARCRFLSPLVLGIVLAPLQHGERFDEGA